MKRKVNLEKFMVLRGLVAAGLLAKSDAIKVLEVSIQTYRRMEALYDFEEPQALITYKMQLQKRG